MPPFLGGGSMINRVWDDHFTPAELPAKFEAGTPPIAPAIALGAAIDYLNAIGLEAVAAPRTRAGPLRLRAAAGNRRPANPRPAARTPRRPGELHARRSPTPTTSPSCSTSKASPSAPATTAPGRCTTGSASPPAPGPASTSTTRRPRSTCWSKLSAKSATASAPKAASDTRKPRRSAAGSAAQAGGPPARHSAAVTAEICRCTYVRLGPSCRHPANGLNHASIRPLMPTAGPTIIRSSLSLPNPPNHSMRTGSHVACPRLAVNCRRCRIDRGC